METSIIGLVLLAGAGATAWYGRLLHATTALMDATPTTPCSKVRTAGFYEVSGVVECDNPMKLPDFDVPCVWWKIRVEEEIKRSNSAGTTWQTVDERSESRPFRVTDRTGSVAVDPKGAELDGAVKTWEQSRGPQFLVGIISGRQTRGGRTTMEYLETGRRVYVLGRVDQAAGQPCFVQGGPAFIVSTQTEEAIKSNKGMWSTLAFGGAAILAVAGAIILATSLGN